MLRAAQIQVATEFTPIVVFFIAGQLFSFSVATTILLVTTAVALVISRCYLGHIAYLPLMSALVAFGFGGLTLLLNVPDFLIFADTLYYLVLASAIAMGFWQQQHFLERVFDATLAMQPAGWRILSWRWLVVLLIAATGNEVARFTLTADDWITYRFVTILAITAFACYQFCLSARYRIPEQSNWLGLRTAASRQES